MALQLEMNLIVNLKIETDRENVTEADIRAAINREDISSVDMERCLRLGANPGSPTLGWVDDNTPVYSYEVAHWEVDRWKIIDTTQERPCVNTTHNALNCIEAELPRGAWCRNCHENHAKDQGRG